MPKITEMYAFIAEDKGSDDEGLVSVLWASPSLSISSPSASPHRLRCRQCPLRTPLVGTDLEGVESLRPIAQNIAKSLGKKAKLVRFTNREDLEEIG